MANQITSKLNQTSTSAVKLQVVTLAIIATLLVAILIALTSASNAPLSVNANATSEQQAPSVATPSDAPQATSDEPSDLTTLEQCILVLETTHDFAPKHCGNITEDDSRLDATYRTIQDTKPDYIDSDICQQVTTIAENLDSIYISDAVETCTLANVTRY
jgi:hypothetical protein